MSENKKVNKLIKRVRKHIGDYYADSIFDRCDMEKLGEFVDRCEENGISSKDQALAFISGAIPPKITFTLDMEGAFKTQKDLVEEAMHMAAHIGQVFGQTPSEISLSSVFPMSDLRFRDINSTGAYMKDNESELLDDEEEVKPIEPDPEWVAKWEKIYKNK